MNKTAEVISSSLTSSSASPVKEACARYPEELEISPRTIAFFIDQHPQADLTRLWQRLGITDDPVGPFNLRYPCGLYKIKTFEFNLDNDTQREVVLQINRQFVESYTYLVFNDSDDDKLLGKIDARSKYRPSDPVVLISNGKPWLIVQQTGATGTGLAAWIDTVYEVSNQGVRRVGSYFAKVSQLGRLSSPTKIFVGGPVSCEIQNGRAILKVSYTIEYLADGSTADGIHLFTKQQEAVLVGSLRSGASSIDTEQSEITPHEFETIYNVDSMGPEEFLQYNQAELRSIASGDNAEKKRWLKEFLDMCEDSLSKRELQGLLH